MTDLMELERGIWQLLDPYRDPLVDNTIYGMPALGSPGAKKHDYFAAVKAATSKVSLFLMPIERHPDALEGLPLMAKAKTGKVTFGFTRLDDATRAELVTLLERLNAAYEAEHPR